MPCVAAPVGASAAPMPKNSIAMARRRLKEVEETGAEVVLSDCNSCIHNLVNAKLRKQKFEIRTTSEFINMLMDEQLKDDSIS